MKSIYPRGLTVLIVEYNAAARIRSTLEHLLKSRDVAGLELELLIIDNNSTDKTISIAKKVWNSTVPIRIVHETKQGVGFGRFTGMLEAKYEYVATVDDDNWVHPDWKQKLIEYMDNAPKAAVIAGRGFPVFECNPPEWFHRYQQNFAVGKQYEMNGNVQDPYRFFYGACCVTRKSAFMNLIDHGFKPIMLARSKERLLAGDETELQILYKLRGWEIHYQDDIRFDHFMPKERLTWNYFKRLRQGFGASALFLDMYREALKSHLTGVPPKCIDWRSSALKSFFSIVKDPLAVFASCLPNYASNHRVATYLAKLGGFKAHMSMKRDFEVVNQTLQDWIKTLPSTTVFTESSIS